MKIPKLGGAGGGPPLGNFSHITPFFLITTLILIKRYVMVELFIFGKNGHQVMWCNLVSIFVICADRIPGVLAILRSKGHQESGGVTKSVHR